MLNISNNFYQNNIEKIILLQNNFKKILNYKNNIRCQLNYFLNICNKIVYQLNKSFDIKILTYSELNSGLSHIFAIVNEIEILNKLSTKELLKLSKFKVLLNIVKINFNIKKNVLKYGLKELKDILNFLFKNESNNSDLVSFYNEIFTPTHLTIYKFENKQYTNINDINNTLDFNNLLKNSVVKLIHSELLYYKLNGATLFYPNKNILYVFNGYFVVDHINAFKKKNIFIKKYNELIHLLMNLKINDEYIKNYINQLSLKDFIIYSNKQLLTNITDKYDDLVKLKKTNINNIINEFIQNDMYYHITTINNLILQPYNLININLINLLLDLLKNDNNYDFSYFYKLLPNHNKLLLET